MASYTTSVIDMPVRYYDKEFQMSHNYAVVDYDQETLSDRSIKVSIKKVTVFYTCAVTDPSAQPKWCTACCGTWGLWWGSDFGGEAIKTWNFSTTFPNGNFSWEKTYTNKTVIIPPTGRYTWQIYKFGNEGDCGITTRSMTIFNTNVPKPTQAPTIKVECSGSATTGSATFSGDYGYCANQSNWTNWSLEQGTNVIKSGSGDSATFSGLAPNTRYSVKAVRGNGCETVADYCNFVTCVPNELSNATATAWDSGQVRLSVTNGGGAYDPSTQIQYRKCNETSWKNGPVSATKTLATIALTDLEADTCYQIRAITTTTACSYTSNVVSFTTPSKCVQAFISDQNVQMNEVTYYTTNEVTVTYNAFSSPFDLWLEYRVKDGYITTWEKTKVQTFSGEGGSTGYKGTATFLLDNLFPNLVEYEVKVIAEAKQDDCYYESDLYYFTTPIIPEPDFTETCDTFVYLSELVCQAVKKLYDGNITVLANPTTVMRCDPYNENPTHLSLWSRLLRFFHAMNCLLCLMSEAGLKSGKESQYYTGEIGWTNILEEVVPDTDSESWRLVASGAAKAYIDSQLHEVWHSHGSVDYMVATIKDRNGLPAEAESCIVTDTDKVYVKKNGNWVEAEEQPDNFAVYHIVNSYGGVKAASAWYFFEGTWNNLDGDVADLEERIRPLFDAPDFIKTTEGQPNKMQIVSEDFDFEKNAQEGVIYIVTENESEEPIMRSISFDTFNESSYPVPTQEVPDGAHAQKPTDPTNIDEEVTFGGWYKDGEEPPECKKDEEEGVVE